MCIRDRYEPLRQPRRCPHASLGRDGRASAGLPEGLVRLAVGLEDIEDLIADLDVALAACPR